MSPAAIQDLWSSGRIARALGCKRDRVEYHLQEFEPLGRFGCARIYSRETYQQVAKRIRELDAGREPSDVGADSKR